MNNITTEEILEYNKMCADFLGAKNVGKKGYLKLDYYQHDLFNRTEWSNTYQDNIEVDTLLVSSMRFHLDWNWIIEVIEQIENLPAKYVVVIKDSTCDIHNIFIKDKPFNFYARYGMLNKRQAAVKAINTFLIWYNETDK